MTVMRGHNDIRSDTISARVERVHLSLDFRYCGRLRFFPAAAGVLATHAVDSVMRVLPVRFVYASDLQIHLPTPLSIKIVLGSLCAN